MAYTEKVMKEIEAKEVILKNGYTPHYVYIEKTVCEHRLSGMLLTYAQALNFYKQEDSEFRFELENLGYEFDGMTNEFEASIYHLNEDDDEPFWEEGRGQYGEEEKILLLVSFFK